MSARRLLQLTTSACAWGHKAIGSHLKVNYWHRWCTCLHPLAEIVVLSSRVFKLYLRLKNSSNPLSTRNSLRHLSQDACKYLHHRPRNARQKKKGSEPKIVDNCRNLSWVIDLMKEWWHVQLTYFHMLLWRTLVGVSLLVKWAFCAMISHCFTKLIRHSFWWSWKLWGLILELRVSRLETKSSALH